MAKQRFSLKGDRGRLEYAITGIIGTPFRILFASELPLSCHITALGFAGTDLGSMPEVIEALSRRGVPMDAGGFVAIINDAYFVRPYSIRQRQELAGAALHEASHHAVWDRPPAKRVLTPQSRLAVATRMETPSTSWPEAVDSPAWGEHDFRFIRCAFHISTRLQKQNFLVNPFTWLNWGSCGYTFNCLDYGEALASDVNSNLDTPLREVLARNAPNAFLALWQEDIRLEELERKGKSNFRSA